MEPVESLAQSIDLGNKMNQECMGLRTIDAKVLVPLSFSHRLPYVHMSCFVLVESHQAS